VVLNELLQNAADHAFPADGGGGTVVLSLRRDADELAIDVADDGVGLPSDFDADVSTGLGLSIVRTLVGSELDGTIRLRPVDPPGRGTVAEIRVPLL
jgi:two-component sensor histidine kinase